jgi:transposase
MPRHTQRPPLILKDEDRNKLKLLARSRTAEVRAVQRAQIILAYAESRSIATAARSANCSREWAYEIVDRVLAIGLAEGVKDKYHRPKDPVITTDAEAWVVHLACTKPLELGYAAELWSFSALAKHVRKHAVEAGHGCLAKAAKATVWRIVNKEDLKPHKIRYYLERRDPQFEEKMRKVLCVYQEVALQNATGEPPTKKVTVSVDEKPGVQAIANTAPDLAPVAGKHPTHARDYEYKRHGTLSILAGLDLHDGHVTARAEDKHRSREFIALLSDLDEYYAKDLTIRLILDNHSAHISKETMGWLARHPGRFEYVHTPKHGSWLNIVETLFGKMARTFLKGIRVQSKAELKERIRRGIAEINAAPVVHRWKKFDLLNEEKKAA